MCGIVACITKKSPCHKVNEILTNGLLQLQNRGYDSAGISYYNPNSEQIITIKYASETNKNAIEKVKEHPGISTMNNSIQMGIAHTRWATHGAKSDVNSHPHLSNDNKISLVHNGIIENYLELKDFLIKTGNFTFVSQTDSEVIVNLISYFYNLYKLNMENAINKTIQKLEGTYGLAIINKDYPNSLFCVANGSPILVGKNDESVIIASEISGFCNYLKSYITLQKNDILTIEVTKTGNLNYTMKHTYETKNITHQQIDLTPAPFSHWTLKEIWEQPSVVEKSINFGGRILDERRVKLGGLDSSVGILSNINHVILLGCGTSEHAALAVQHIFKNICNFTTVQVINASEFSCLDVPKHGKTGIIMISQSGETKDLHCCFESMKEKNVITIGVVNVVDSLIAREVNCGVYCNAGREVAVASTKSFTSQVVCLSLIAIWFSEIHKIGEHKRMKIIKDLNQLSFDIENTLKEIQSQMEEISSEFIEREFHKLFILGKKEDESIAKEGALKIKEITYIHAEGCSATALKHGPFALLDENMPVILIDHAEYHSKIRNTWEEVHSRNAPLYLITSDTKHIRGKTIVVNKNESFQNILNVLPLQMLAYSISVAKGINPDTPKNLAKVVTVE